MSTWAGYALMAPPPALGFCVPPPDRLPPSTADTAALLRAFWSLVSFAATSARNDSRLPLPRMR